MSSILRGSEICSQCFESIVPGSWRAMCVYDLLEPTFNYLISILRTLNTKGYNYRR